MKAITLYQPWATLVAIGAKRMETRSWSTRYRGPLAIHAAKVMPDCVTRVTSENDQIEITLLNAGFLPPNYIQDEHQLKNKYHKLVTGAIVAMCVLEGTIQIDRVGWFYIVDISSSRGFSQTRRIFLPPGEPERSFGDYSAGRFAWILGDVRPVEPPIPARGRQGLWDWQAPEGF